LKNIDFYKWTIYLGVFFTISFGIICILQETDADILHFNFGIFPYILLLVFLLFIGLFFRLSFKLWKIKIIKKLDFAKLALLGIPVIIFPVFLFCKWIFDILQPAKQTEIEKLIMPYVHFAFSVSQYTKDLNRLSDITLFGISFSIILTLILSYRIYLKSRNLKFDNSIYSQELEGN